VNTHCSVSVQLPSIEMVAPATPAALHLLTPGSPAYAMLKVGAIGGIFALRFALVRRNRNTEEAAEAPSPAAPMAERRQPHPVSKKKKRRRRR
jgi:hypothetical protein